MSTPTPQPTVDLTSAALNDAVSQAVAASVVMQTYAQTILNQPIINGISELPNLADHQNTAIAHATYWTQTLQPQIVQLQDDINGFCNNFLSYYTPLSALAQAIVGGDTSKVSQFNQGLSDLEGMVSTNYGSATTVFNGLTTFETQSLSPDVQNFNADYTTASTAIIGDNGELSQLNDELNAVMSATQRDIGIIGGGATGAVVGIVMICVGALGEFETAGVSTGLIVAGLAVTAGGTAAAIAAGVDLSNQNDSYSKLTTQIATINADMNALTTVKGQIQGMEAALQAAETAIQQVANEWSVVKANFSTLETQLTDNVSAVSPFLVQELQAAQLDWQALQTHVQALESFKQVPTTEQPVGQVTQHAA